MASALYRQVRQARTLALLPVVLVQLRRTRNQRDIESLLSLAFDGFERTIRPFQNPKEIRGLVERVASLQPKRIVEIGTANGGTLFLLTRSAPDEAHIISVDLPGGWFGGGYARWKQFLYRSFTRPGQRLDLIRADSHLEDTFARVRTLLDGKAIDFLMIDGDHTYAGVKHDFETYSPLVRSGGIVAFHDIVPNRFDVDIEVDRFWLEVKVGRDTDELVADRMQSGAGIGIIRV